MSKESATKFLEAAARDLDVQAKFEKVSTPQEFLQVAEQLGYDFTTEELKDVVKEHSQGVTMRRNTGVWRWLRGVNWV